MISQVETLIEGYTDLLIFLSSATFLAFFSFSKAINLSPAEGLSDNPVIDTGIEGDAFTKFSPLSFLRVLTLPEIVPTTIGSPNLRVPFSINRFVITPDDLSIFDSITVPVAYLSGLAFNCY